MLNMFWCVISHRCSLMLMTERSQGFLHTSSGCIRSRHVLGAIQNHLRCGRHCSLRACSPCRRRTAWNTSAHEHSANLLSRRVGNHGRRHRWIQVKYFATCRRTVHKDKDDHSHNRQWRACHRRPGYDDGQDIHGRTSFLSCVGGTLKCRRSIFIYSSILEHCLDKSS